MKKVLLGLCVFLAMSCQGSTTASDQNTKTNQNETVKASETSNTPVAQTSDIPKVEPYVQKPVDPKDIVPPLQAIKDLDKTVESYQVGQNLTPEQVQSNLELKQKIIRGTFDIRELCRLSLGQHWTTITEEQQNSFVDMMTLLLETKAIFSKEQLRGDNKLYTINYRKEQFDDAEKKKATVFTTMNVTKEKLNLEIVYKMLLTPYGWKIFDVVVDEASLLSNYKFQFDRIIQKNGFADLMERMKAKLTKISQPKPEKPKAP